MVVSAVCEPVLVVAAHPDDEVLGCGGTIARLARGKRDVHIVILGEGATSRHAQGDQAAVPAVRLLERQSEQVGRLLGAKDVRTHGLPDNSFDTVPLLQIAKLIEEAIDSIKPGTVYTHHGGDLNADHSLSHRATLIATRPTPDSPVKAVYAYEVPSSTDWALSGVTPAFHPNVFVDIAGTLNQKVEAMRLYESEVREFPHPRSEEALVANARRWGSVAGVHAAEAFVLVRSVLRTTSRP